MGRAHVDSPLGVRVDPSAQDATAREGKRVRTVTFDNGQFEIAVERRS